jgi:hypothetical protein
MGNWAGEKKNIRFAKPTTFWQRLVRNNIRQEGVSSHTWRGHMAGQTRPHNCQYYRASNRVTNSGYGSRVDSR